MPFSLRLFEWTKGGCSSHVRHRWQSCHCFATWPIHHWHSQPESDLSTWAIPSQCRCKVGCLAAWRVWMVAGPCFVFSMTKLAPGKSRVPDFPYPACTTWTCHWHLSIHSSFFHLVKQLLWGNTLKPEPWWDSNAFLPPSVPVHQRGLVFPLPS